MNQPRTSIQTEFLMTIHAPLDAAQLANADLRIYTAIPGGWVKGPAIQGEIIAPTGDWLRTMPNGTERLDVRMSIRADDGSIIFVTYTGRIVTSEQTNKRLAAGEEIGPNDAYFVTSPTFETTSKKYGWLNDIVAVGKMVSLKGGQGGHVAYEIFAVK